MGSCSNFSASLALRYLSKLATMHASPLLFIGVIACCSHMAAGVEDKRLSQAILGDDECASDDATRCSLSARQLRGEVLSLEAQEEEVDVSDGEFVASKSFGSFDWTPTQRTIEAAIQDAKWNGDGQFHEGETVNAVSVAKWVNEDLLVNPPFNGAHDAIVPMPASGDDQVGPGNYVAYSRRQVCYIVAKTLMGAGTKEYDNGLTRFMNTCVRTGGFAKSMVTLVASCAADPTLKDGKQGPLLVVARGADPTSVQAARGVAASARLSNAGLRICQYDDGAAPLDGIPKVPSEGCVSATGSGPGKDFMTGGLHRQVVVDITASWLGGYVLGNACGLGGGQDERLMTYMPEVFLLTFFLSEAPGTNPQERHTPQLRMPAWILGARLVMTGLDGTAAHESPPLLDTKVAMKSDLVDIEIEGKKARISSSRPFLAFMSENQDYEMTSGACPGVTPYNDGVCDRGCRTRKARTNRFEYQRAVDPACSWSFGNQVRAWYRSTALTSYAGELHDTLRKVVKSLGSGPWGSGLWWGDSQLMTLAMWLGHAAAAKTWGQGAEALPLDYYMYSAFTENPGNQCYNHAGDSCKACLANCGTPPESAYWLPGFAYSGADGFTDWGAPPPSMGAKACTTGTSSCGAKGLADVVAAYTSATAGSLWTDVETMLKSNGPGSAAGVSTNAFDALLANHR
mmetsp:Transcript_24161/g.68430  ORF Transcript_24161/g.68430 Transcript_24161/m.68430 type:complete len:683 (-) Transcript_24161:83-2131(-)